MSVLALGQAFGRVPWQWSAESLTLSPVIHDQSRVNPSHSHEAAFVTMMLGGEYTETAARRLMRFERFSAIYHPPGVEHQDFIGKPGVQLLVFEFRPSLLDDVEIDPGGFRSLRDLSGSRAAWELLKLYRDASGGAAQLDFEARALDLIAHVVPFPRTVPRDRPSLVRARDYLQASFRERVTMEDVSRAAGIHPVYLGQAFHYEFGETIADHVSRLRVRAAAAQLSGTDMPIAAIAFDHGFCDQSHFQRVFKKLSGLTPAEFRRSFAAE
jgi:AraC family transcriptional regulator